MSVVKETLILNSILNSTKSIVYLYNLENKEIRFLNRGIYDDLGYARFEKDTIPVSQFIEKIHSDDQAKFQSFIDSILLGREKKFTTIEYRLQTKRGDWKWYSDTIFILITGELKTRELIGYASDITTFRRKEETYLREEILLKAILDNTREFYFFLDLEFKIKSLNKNAKDFLYSKIGRNVVEGYSILDCLPLESPNIFVEKFNYALSGRTIQYESSFINEKGKVEWFQFRYLPVSDKKNRINGICFVFMDITDVRLSNQRLIQLNRDLEDIVSERTKELKEEVAQRKNTEDRLLVALEKEKELNELKSKFITMVSHEFRTPMTAISMSSQILEKYGDGYSKSDREKHYKRIKEAILSLNNLMESVLNISRSEASNIPFTPTSVNLEMFLKNLISNYESIYPKYEFILQIGKNERSFFKLDLNLITHILDNLLSNAIKYSVNNFQIILKVNIGDTFIEFIIKDFGLGIPLEDQSQIFQTFYRGNNVGNISGTGLGLNIVKIFVELHGGKVYFESSQKDGTEFHVIIPMEY